MSWHQELRFDRYLAVTANTRRTRRNPVHFDHILIVTYGRSGSTLLQGVLNSIDGVLIRGENDNLFYDLFRFWRRAGEVRDRFGHASTPEQPWYGASELSQESLLDELRSVARTVLLGDEDVRSIRCLGFKEIRYGGVGGDLYAYLDFLQQLLPNAAIIVNTRNLDEVAKSGWWRDRPEKQVRHELLALEEKIKKYAMARPNGFTIDYADVASVGPRLKELFQFLGASWQPERIDVVLAVPHSFQSSDSGDR